MASKTGRSVESVMRRKGCYGAPPTSMRERCPLTVNPDGLQESIVEVEARCDLLVKQVKRLR